MVRSSRRKSRKSSKARKSRTHMRRKVSPCKGLPRRTCKRYGCTYVWGKKRKYCRGKKRC